MFLVDIYWLSKLYWPQEGSSKDVDEYVAYGGYDALWRATTITESHDVSETPVSTPMAKYTYTGGAVARVDFNYQDTEHDGFSSMRFYYRDVDNDHDAETGADHDAMREEAGDVFGFGGGGDVVVFGRQSKEMIAHGAADEIRLVPVPAKGFDNRQGFFVFGIGSFHTPFTPTGLTSYQREYRGAQESSTTN